MSNNFVKKHDNLDLIRALLAGDTFLVSCQKREKCDIVYNASFERNPLEEEKISEIYSKYPQLYEMDDKYLVGGNYYIGFNVVSRHRLLKNLLNYKGKGNAFEESLRHNSNVKNIEEVINTLSTLEMGDESVNVSQGIRYN